MEEETVATAATAAAAAAAARMSNAPGMLGEQGGNAHDRRESVDY